MIEALSSHVFRSLVAPSEFIIFCILSNNDVKSSIRIYKLKFVLRSTYVTYGSNLIKFLVFQYIILPQFCFNPNIFRFGFSSPIFFYFLGLDDNLEKLIPLLLLKKKLLHSGHDLLDVGHDIGDKVVGIVKFCKD